MAEKVSVNRVERQWLRCRVSRAGQRGVSRGSMFQRHDVFTPHESSAGSTLRHRINLDAARENRQCLTAGVVEDAPQAKHGDIPPSCIILQ